MFFLFYRIITAAYLYKGAFAEVLMSKKRLKAHKQRTMNRRLKSNKGPMSDNEKLARRKNTVLQKELNIAKLAK